MKIKDIDTFTRHYLIAALWSSSTDDGGPLDPLYNLDNIHSDTVAQAFADCDDFQVEYDQLLRIAYEHYHESGRAAHPDAGSPEACAGHDFWLTRARHGCGFWDRGMGKVGEHLTQAAQNYGSLDLWVDAVGKVRS